MGLRLNGTHNVRVVSWREGCEGLIGDKTFVLFVLSNQAIGVLDDGNSKFIEQVHLCLEQGVHCLPIFLQRDGAEFSIPSLLSYKYSRAEVSPTLRNLLLLQGLRIDTSDAKRSTPRILAARQIVLGLLNTEGVDSNPDKLSQTEMRELYGFLKPSLNEVNQVQKMLLDAIVPETRNWTLNDIKALLEGGHVWVGGEGRVGKSTISALLARELEKRDELAAYFPFSRETQHLATPSDLIQTIAYTLSLRIPPVGRYILSLFQASLIDYSKSNPSSLFLQLIVEPMREVSIYYKFETPLVLILDGLDECGEAGQVDGSGRVVRSEDLVGIMEKCVPLLPAECIRVVAFSRITDAYVNVFKEWGSWFEVQVTDERNKGDVELVAEMLLERSGVQDGLDRQKMIELLVRKSGGLIEWVVDVVGVLKETGLTVEAFEKLEQTALVKYSKITQIK
ncbi:hypothetical protein BCR33DRAFT_715041 [Rhizoclosmatium globosum]|uniref:Nephrocystin 3-like N-terminal domain-containing protein n=1 Tax=Rhizoclosmatium globosum TaxID=329046 RepID=A0A1Y2CJW6_9FUNG|nr:hypothetical protein BCR33DRAFT_715041 [Rhizoclosmatium globosum]|eukprot:ORY47290.1 hypothetical protein BCR33DRAFT_715041 [Rhizoclosmatium globosum]